MPPTESTHRAPRPAWVVACSISCVLHASVLVVCGSLPFASAGRTGNELGDGQVVFELRLSVRRDDPIAEDHPPRAVAYEAPAEPVATLSTASPAFVETPPIQTDPPPSDSRKALVLGPRTEPRVEPTASEPVAESVPARTAVQPATEAPSGPAPVLQPPVIVASTPLDGAVVDQVVAAVVAGATLDVARAGGATRAAVVTENPRPEYPYDSALRGEHGEVVCLLHITADGRVANVEVVSSCGYKRLDRAAIDGLKRWRFQPALENGVAVASKLRHKVTFVFE